MKSLNKARSCAAVLAAVLLPVSPTRPAPVRPAPIRLTPNQALVLSGVAQWCPPNKPPSLLRRGRSQPFSPGDTVRCGPHSRLQMRLTGSPFLVENPDGVWQDWPIPSGGVSPSGVYVPILGRARGPNVPRILPVPMDPRTFVISWPIPTEGRSPLSLRLYAPDRILLWRQDGVDAGSGCLFSPAARRALGKYQAAGGAGPVTLILLREGGGFQPLAFTLASPVSPSP